MSAAQQQEENTIENLRNQLANAMESLQRMNVQNANLQEENMFMQADAERAARFSDFMLEQHFFELQRAQEELRSQKSRADFYEEAVQRFRRVDEEDGSQEEEEIFYEVGTEEESSGEETEFEEESGKEETSEEEEGRFEENSNEREFYDNVIAIAYDRLIGVREIQGRDDLEIRQVAARYDW